MLNNNTQEQNEDKKIADSSKNGINESDGLSIMTKTKTDIHHLAMNKNNEESKVTLIPYVSICSHHGNLNY